jgi:hypothetical protein
MIGDCAKRRAWETKPQRFEKRCKHSADYVCNFRLLFGSLGMVTTIQYWRKK